MIELLDELSSLREILIMELKNDEKIEKFKSALFSIRNSWASCSRSPSSRN